jgi:hypothetical protein
MLDTFVIFKNLPKVDKHPNGRTFAQSGHPVAKKKEGEKKKKEFFEATKRPEKKLATQSFGWRHKKISRKMQHFNGIKTACCQ